MEQPPLISLVTVSYNQGQFLEDTIRSVLDQGYPNLRYGIVDGGSTDGSDRIIERYRDRLAFAVIEPDDGQADAINKGLRRAAGGSDTVVGFLNSDDTLTPGSLAAVGRHFADHPESQWAVGHCRYIDTAGESTRDPRSGDKRMTATPVTGLAHALLRDRPFALPQPSIFWRRRLLESYGLFEASLHYTFDFEMWCRFLAEGYRPAVIDRELSTYRLHHDSKTVSQWSGCLRDHIEVEKRYVRRLAPRDRMAVRRMIGYRTRQLAVMEAKSRPWSATLKHPWWLLSQQVVKALVVGKPRDQTLRELTEADLAAA